MANGRLILKSILEWKNFFIVFLIPFLLLPIAASVDESDPDYKVSRCAYGVLVIGIFWVTEALPLAVTSLLPVVFFPLLGVMSAGDVCKSYFKDTLMLFLGSLIVAVAVERCDLHRRIALRALTLVGPEPRWLMLGIMLPCWFLSMWMSNTATTAMMVPILSAILSQIKACKEADAAAALVDSNDPEANNKDKAIEMEDLVKENGGDAAANKPLKNCLEGESEDFVKLAKTFALCTAYAANAGGMATLTGTPPNIVFKGIADKLFEDYNEDSGITFANWLVIGFPLSLITFVFIWIWMQVYYGGKKCFPCVKQDKGQYDSVKAYLHKEYSTLGPMRFAEIVVLVDFILLVVLWISRKPEFVPGWGNLFPKKYVSDSIAAVLMGVVLFVLPYYPPDFNRCRSNPETDILDTDTEQEERKGYVPILNWEIVNRKLAWGVILLMGGGFALADACEHAGLSGWVGENLKSMGVLPGWVIGLILAYIVAGITNITSNSATATLFLPIAGKLAINLEMHPLYLMIPVAIAASFAFLLPVGTPPNAIVFSTGYLKVSDMVIAGAVVNIVSVLFLVVAMNLWIVPFYGLTTIPPGFLKNVTTTTTAALLNTTTGIPTTTII